MEKQADLEFPVNVISHWLSDQVFCLGFLLLTGIGMDK